MYRSKCILAKRCRTILTYRSRLVTAQTRGLLENSSNIKNRGSYGQFMSTSSEKQLHWGFKVGSVGVVIGGLALLAKNSLFKRKITEKEVQSDHEKEIPLSVENDVEVVNIVDGSSPSQIDFEVEEEYVIVKEEEVEIIGIENETVAEAEGETPSKLLESKQLQILTTAYENLKIILDDTITTKTSAVRMLNGYITQFTQALVVAKEDRAYESIWEVISLLDHSIKESVNLVKTKETEVKSQIENINSLIYDVRKNGMSDLTNKAEELIVSSKERLLSDESEIELLTNKVKFLLQFRRRLEGSHKKVQLYLHAFIPDFMKLLNLKQKIDVENLSDEDLLLMLSLSRPELIYAEVQEKEMEQKLRFEATLQQQKEIVMKEAHEHVNDIVEKLEADKENELNQKVEDLKQLHENHLQEELKIQYDTQQKELYDANAKQVSESTEQYITELELMLKEQEDRHSHEMNNSLSSLKGMELKITDIDDKSQKNLRLWAAIHALNTTLNDISDNGRTKKLTPEISNILQCNCDEDVLSTIVSAIPESAVNLGVVPEYALIQHFNDIKRLCKRVAMVKDESGSFLAYTFSFIKSLFVISRFYQRPISDEIDLENLGPYEILEKAEYYIKQGDLEQAAKFMSQLNGVPRKLSNDWLKEVRLLLETKQSVNLVMAYVGSLNVGFE